MAFDLSFGSLNSARDRLTRMRDESSDSGVAKRGRHALETFGTSFGFAWLQARFEKSSPGLVAPLGVPIDLLFGVGISGLALALPYIGEGLATGYEDDMMAIGTGALAVYAAKMGAEMGSTGATASMAKTAGVSLGAPVFHVAAGDLNAMGATAPRRPW